MEENTHPGSENLIQIADRRSYELRTLFYIKQKESCSAPLSAVLM